LLERFNYPQRLLEVFMKLYYSPAACSLSPHIALCEAGLPVELIKVDLGTKKTATGGDFMEINSKGYVPTLELDDGTILTEGPAILQYIADKNPAAGLVPAAGTMERYRLQEMLNFISTELHKGFSPLFNPKAPAEWKTEVRATIAKRFDWLTQYLEGKTYLLEEKFSVADGYLFTILYWTRWVDVDLSKWPVLKAFFDRVAARPKVQQALEEEGVKA
jgi:glutathione S-transferase